MRPWRCDAVCLLFVFILVDARPIFFPGFSKIKHLNTILLKIYLSCFSHTGCTATLVDVIGTGALLTIASRGGVSLNINVTYVDSMPGTQISGKSRGVIVDAHVLRVGRTVSTIAVDFYDEEDGRLVASGTHVKYVSDKEPDLSKHLGQALSGENIDRPLSTEQLKAGSRGRSKSVRHASAADEHGTRSRL